MSRHRYVRNMDLDEAYEDAYDDTVYGRSLDDDIVSPSAQQYMYSHARGRYDSLSAAGEDIAEENYGDYDQEPEPYKKPTLSAEDEARLLSVIDQLRNVLGESVTDAEMTDAAITNNFDVEKSLDKLLNQPPKSSQQKQSQPKASASGTVPATSTASASGFVKKRGKKNKKGGAGEGGAGAISHPVAVGGKKANKANADTPVRGATTVTANAIRVVKGFNLPQQTGDGDVASRDGSPCPDDDVTATLAAVKRPARLPTRQRDRAVDAVSQLETAGGGETGGRRLINLVVVGHVDAGKSTLTGHLLYKQGNVSKRVMHKYEQESRKTGKQTAYAWVMDETEEERSRGVTVDVAERSFESNTKLVNILDAPGHRDFIPNMISGAARADVALLVVDASTGEFEAGFESNGQTREHAMLIKSLGVSQLSVAINKLDSVQWSKDRFEEIRASLSTFLKTVGFRSSDVTYIPCSGLTGENLTSAPAEKALSQWYTGPNVLQAIDEMEPPAREVTQPTRLSISDVFKGPSSNMCVTGKLHTGYVCKHDKLILMPLMIALTVKDVVSGSGSSGELFAGDSGTLTVSGAEPEELTVGSFLCDPAHLMSHTTSLFARIVVFNILVPLIQGTQVEFHHQSLCEPATVRRLVSQINKTTGEVVKNKPRVLAKQSAGVIEIELSRPVCLETYKDNKQLGRFMLRQHGHTVAAGLVTEILHSRNTDGACGGAASGL